MSFCVVSPNTENGKNTERTQLFKIPTGILLRGCLLGAPGCSFSGSLKFEKHTFPKKGPDLKKHGISPYSMVLAQKSVPLIFGPPRISRKSLKNVSKSDPKTNSEKKRDLVFVLGRKGSETWLLGRSRGLSVWTSGLQNAHFGPQRPDKNANPRHKLLQKILQKIHARNLGYPNAQKHFRCGGLAQAS